jgi:hypothetical protein
VGAAPLPKRPKVEEAAAAPSSKAPGAGGPSPSPRPKSNSNALAGTAGGASLRVENFLRPFTAKAARELVELAGGGACALKPGDEGFWMDSIKTTAVATFDGSGSGAGTAAAAAAAALAAVHALDGAVWPLEHGRVLAAKLCDTAAGAMRAGQEHERRLRQEALAALRSGGGAAKSTSAFALGPAAASQRAAAARANGTAATATAAAATAAVRPGLAASRLGAPPGTASAAVSLSSLSSRGAVAAVAAPAVAAAAAAVAGSGALSAAELSGSSGRSGGSTVLKKGRGLHLAQFDALRPWSEIRGKPFAVDDVFLRTQVRPERLHN